MKEKESRHVDPRYENRNIRYEGPMYVLTWLQNEVSDCILLR